MFQITSYWWLDLVMLLSALCAVTYYFCTCTFNKWEKLNVPYAKPVPLFGNFLYVALGMIHQIDLYRSIYNDLRGHKYGGLFQMRTPYLMLRDPEIISNVLVKDFSHFTDRGIYSDFSMNPLSDNMFFMQGDRWKTIRKKLTPVFTPGKLKLMYDQIKSCSEELMKDINRKLQTKTGGGNDIEVKELLGKYFTDIIGTCAYGLKLNVIGSGDEESSFRKYGKSIFVPSMRTHLRELSLMICPGLLKVVRFKDFPADAVAFFYSAFNETIAYREKHNIVRNDFVQALMKARTDLVLNKNIPQKEKFTESQIVANAFVMFAAGFETVSAAMTFCLYELALKTHIQDRVREEMKQKLAENNNEINNDLLVNLNYLDMVMAEIFRKYPPVFAIFREAVQTYHVPNDSLIIEKGQKIMIPIHSLHFDHKYYKDPEVFDPERFLPEQKAKLINGTYLPFGDGPRMCIGKRFAELEMKLALVELLTNFEVEPCEKTEIPIVFCKKSLLIHPVTGIWLTFKKLTNN